MRELKEETGLDAARYALTDWGKQNQYEIFQRWRNRYAPGVTHNTEHVFSLLVPEPLADRRSSRASTCATSGCRGERAAEKVFSWSNADAIRELPQRSARNAANNPVQCADFANLSQHFLSYKRDGY